MIGFGRYRLSAEQRAALRDRGWFVARVPRRRLHALAQAAAAHVGEEHGLRRADLDATFELSLPQYGVVERTNEAQSLHFDYGHPIDVDEPTNLYASLAVQRAPGPGDAAPAGTRVVRLADLARAREWPAWPEALERVRAYGATHGSWLGWDGGAGYVERTLARLVDAVDGTNELTSYRDLPREQWLEASFGGNEFETHADEERFFARHGIDLEALTETVTLAPGETLVIDNTAVCHSRRGRRSGGEIRQVVCGRRRAEPDAATAWGRRILRRLLA